MTLLPLAIVGLAVFVGTQAGIGAGLATLALGLLVYVAASVLMTRLTGHGEFMKAWTTQFGDADAFPTERSAMFRAWRRTKLDGRRPPADEFIAQVASRLRRM